MFSCDFQVCCGALDLLETNRQMDFYKTRREGAMELPSLYGGHIYLNSYSAFVDFIFYDAISLSGELFFSNSPPAYGAQNSGQTAKQNL